MLHKVVMPYVSSQDVYLSAAPLAQITAVPTQGLSGQCVLLPGCCFLWLSLPYKETANAIRVSQGNLRWASTWEYKSLILHS